MDVQQLRDATESDHRAAEGSLLVMADDLDLTRYVAMLNRLHGFLVGWEAWTKLVVSKPLRKLLLTRNRSSLIVADLDYFAISAAPDRYDGPFLSPASEAEVLGAMYVMEGSTLGGQIIARHVERVLSLKAGCGDAFFRGHGDQTGPMWQEVRSVLAALPDSETMTVIRSAKCLFADFTAWNRVVAERKEGVYV